MSDTTRPHYALYDGKVIPIDYATPKDQFRRACQRVHDNATRDGHVVTPKGQVYNISRSFRAARIVTGDEAALIVAQAKEATP